MTKQPDPKNINIATLVLLAIATYLAITNPGYEIPFGVGLTTWLLVMNIYQRQWLRRRISKRVRRAIAIAGIIAVIGPMVTYAGPLPIDTSHIVIAIADCFGWGFLAVTVACLFLSLYWPDHPDDNDQGRARRAKDANSTDPSSPPVQQQPAAR